MYYDPDTLEICTVPDCGGGRAAPKTGVPGCPLYSGTATPTPSFLSADPLAPSTTSSVAAETSSAATLTGFSQGDSASGTTQATLTTAPGPVNATGTSGASQATGVSTGGEGSSTGAATGTPSGSVDTSSGDVVRVTMGGVSVALALAAAFVV